MTKKKAPKTKKPEPAFQVPQPKLIALPPIVAYYHAEQVLARHEKQLLGLPGVQSVSVGPRYRAGKSTGEFALRLHVKTRAEKLALRESAINGGVDLKAIYEGVPVDIVVWNFKPLCGTGLNGPGGRATLGATVFFSGTAVWLTAGHLASAAPVSSLPAAVNICDDSGVAIGRIPAASGLFYARDQWVDGALVVPFGTVPLPAGHPTRNVTGDDVAAGSIVTIVGAKSCHSSGRVTAVKHSPITIFAGAHSEEVVDHFLVAGDDGSFANFQDSGAVAMIGSHVVGLVRAGDDENNIAILCQVSNVIGGLKVTF